METQPEQIILVDEHDNPIGQGEKLEVHKKGLLHRAFSIFVFNDKRELLLQRRAKVKYHSGGLWSNTCCGHPRPGEPTKAAAERRLNEEFGFSCDLKEIGTLTYQTPFENGLSEHEFLYVFTGIFEGLPQPNPQEMDEFRWTTLAEVKKDAELNPDSYTYWFKVMLKNKILDNEQ